MQQYYADRLLGERTGKMCENERAENRIEWGRGGAGGFYAILRGFIFRGLGGVYEF
jgi:hypothetical protein